MKEVKEDEEMEDEEVKDSIQEYFCILNYLV